MIDDSILDFLNKLSSNNNREWFNQNRNLYEASKEKFLLFVDVMLKQLQLIEPTFANTQAKDCVFRINRDIRFSKDKSPYKNHFSAAFGHGGRNSGRIDYYFQLQPGDSFLGAGMWQPTPRNLTLFRQELDYNPDTLKSIIFSDKFTEAFPEAYGEKLKKVPKGYDINHPEKELLKRKELFYICRFDDIEIVSKNFENLLFAKMVILKPYIDYLNHLFFLNENETEEYIELL
jgi:uncharacterized protein (TIGR02453 family)